MTSLPSAITTSRATRPYEQIAVALILLLPCMGTFFAPETYFSPQEFSLQSAYHREEIGFPFGRLAFVLILAWLLPKYIQNAKILSLASLRSAIPILFIVWALISAFWTADPTASLNRSGRILILVFFAIYLVERFESDEIIYLATLCGAVAIAASLFAIIALPSYSYSTLTGYENAWRGATSHKNALGALMSIIFLFGYYSTHTKNTPFLLSAFAIFGSIFLILMSKSATSILVLVMSIGFIIILNFLNAFKTNGEKIFFLMVIAIFLTLGSFIYFYLDELLLLLGKDPTFTGRADVWQSAMALIDAKPFLGYGHGFWSIDSPERDNIWSELGWAAPHAHNMFLDIRLQLGLIGFVIAVLLFSTAMWRIVRLVSLSVPVFMLIWPMIFLTTLLRGTTETYLIHPDSSGLFWCALSFAAMTKLCSQTSVQIRFKAPYTNYSHEGNFQKSLKN